jgi:hypothetical protein
MGCPPPLSTGRFGDLRCQGHTASSRRRCNRRFVPSLSRRSDLHLPIVSEETTSEVESVSRRKVERGRLRRRCRCLFVMSSHVGDGREFAGNSNAVVADVAASPAITVRDRDARSYGAAVEHLTVVQGRAVLPPLPAAAVRTQLSVYGIPGPSPALAPDPSIHSRWGAK